MTIKLDEDSVENRDKRKEKGQGTWAHDLEIDWQLTCKVEEQTEMSSG